MPRRKTLLVKVKSVFICPFENCEGQLFYTTESVRSAMNENFEILECRKCGRQFELKMVQIKKANKYTYRE